jgi:hypothetical protein
MRRFTDRSSRLGRASLGTQVPPSGLRSSLEDDRDWPVAIELQLGTERDERAGDASRELAERRWRLGGLVPHRSKRANPTRGAGNRPLSQETLRVGRKRAEGPAPPLRRGCKELRPLFDIRVERGPFRELSPPAHGVVRPGPPPSNQKLERGSLGRSDVPPLRFHTPFTFNR